MEKTNLYIPKKCKVGLQRREGTYTGKLGYIIYHDGKVWRKEKSWEGWRHKEGQNYGYWNPETREQTNETLTGVEPIEFENVPTEGFVLNKKAGGYSSGWNHRQTYCRVYDPRGWEFEITIPNLLYILQECSAYKGKGLEGEFVYSWEGKDLVLLPVSSPDYKECQAFTDLQSQKIGKKDLVEGCTYMTSSMNKLVYLGQHNVCERTYYARTAIENKDYDYDSKADFEKRMVFRGEGDYDEYNNVFVFLKALGSIKAKVSNDTDPNFAQYMEELQKSEYYSEPDHLEVTPIVKTRYRSDPFEYQWSQTVYKFGEIKTYQDYKSLERRMERIVDGTSNEKIWKVSIPRQVKRTNNSYWGSRDYYDTVYDEEGRFTKEELLKRYGYVSRVYKNGFKKVI